MGLPYDTQPGDASPSAQRNVKSPSNDFQVIRHKPTYMVLNGFGLACCAFLVVRPWVWAPAYRLEPFWLYEAIYIAGFGMFLYSILRHVRGPIVPTQFVLSIGERNVWAIKGTLLVLLAIVLIAVLLARFH